MSKLIVQPTWKFLFRDPKGRVVHTERVANTVVNTGRSYAALVTFAGGTKISSWYVGLTSSAPTISVSDTMASHAGWTEVTDYSESTRVPWVHGGTETSYKVTNTLSKARFTINQDATIIGGAFLTSASDKSGNTGTLISGAPLASGDKQVNTFGTLDITIEYQF